MDNATFKTRIFDRNSTYELNCNSYSIQNQGNTNVEVNGWLIEPSGAVNCEPSVKLKINWTLVINFVGQLNQESTEADNNKLFLIEYDYDYKC